MDKMAETKAEVLRSRPEAAADPGKGSHSRKKLDLTGQRYGHLTVLGPAPNIAARTAWRCRCDCGKETVVKTVRLRSGHTISCGCMRPVDENGNTDILKTLTLVDGTCVEMLRRTEPRRNNTSGVAGVDWMPSKQRWRATLCFKGERHYLGCYANLADAAAARQKAEKTYFEPFLAQYEEISGGEAGANLG